MRIVPVLLVVVFLIPAYAVAQPPAAPAAPTPAAEVPTGSELRQMEFGVRASGFSGDAARAQRFRDLRTGPTLDRLRYERDRGAWTFAAEIDHAGYRDQRYAAEIERPGKLTASLEWNQVPLFYSDITRSPFRAESPGVLRLDDTVQAAVQNRTAALAGYGGLLVGFETMSRRDVAGLKLRYELTRDLDLQFGLTSTHRTGEQPWNASFGFSNAIEV